MSAGTAEAPGTTKVFLAGTHRVRHPAATWNIIRPKLRRFGVTRIADVTGLDSLGVPVAMAVRPAATTLSVSQGKGRTYELARVSAAMEALELWHAENDVVAPVHRRAPGRELGLPYRVASLADPGGLVGGATPLDWVPATGMGSGTTVPVPAALVLYTHAPAQPWMPPGLSWSSNGLASGNSRPEAFLHGLYEVIERDAVSADRGVPTRPVDPVSVTDPECAEVIARIRHAGVRLDLQVLDSRFGVPCFGATVWSPDFAVACRGWGAHSTPAVALSRAITEAAQSRLTAIVGSRDDLPPIYEHARLGAGEPAVPPAEQAAWAEVVSPWREEFPDVAEEARWLVARVTRVSATEPLMVDLTVDPDVCVVKVLVPGTAMDIDRVHPAP